MRQCAVRVPQAKSKWRLVSELREDGLLPDSESEEESSVVEETEEEFSELETDGETEESEEESESSESEESEEDIDWYGLIET